MMMLYEFLIAYAILGLLIAEAALKREYIIPNGNQSKAMIYATIILIWLPFLLWLATFGKPDTEDKSK